MGIKKFFKPKPPKEATPEENRENLMDMGISVKNPNKKKREKFAAYGKFAKDRMGDRFYAPEGYEAYAHPTTEEGDIEDLNKSPLDPPATSTTTPQPAGKTQRSYDPYAVDLNNTISEDPYARFQNTIRNNNSQINGGSTADPYTRTDIYARRPAQPNISTNNAAYIKNSNNDNKTIDMNHRSPAKSRSTNPYQNMKPASNPYAAMNSDSYMNSMSAQTVANSITSKDNSTYTQSQPYNSGRIPEKPKSASYETEFDFEKTEHDNDDILDAYTDEVYGQNDETKAALTDELDLNAAPGEISETFQQQQQQQQFQERPAWQLEEEEEEQHFQGYRDNDYNTASAQRGYKTFEELQREEEQRQQAEEDEAVDEIKQEIRFTKQSSVASTKNTLKMAQEAEMAGMNTLGLLGHQSEKLNNVETNLNLMKVQNRVADDKVSELKKLNRSILAVHASNPFNSKRRQMEKEEKLKNRKIEERLMAQNATRDLSRSTQRIEGAMNSIGETTNSAVREKYQRKEILERAKKYQFENDEEDDEMELEIDRNLDKIQQISGRLKRLAVATGEELDGQQERIKKIEEDSDNLDIKIHMNTMRLANIR